MENFQQTEVTELTENFVRAIGTEWMLITAGDAAQCNTMTASWGFIGQMWGKPAAAVVIRPSRYTKTFVDAHERLTLSFFDEAYRKALQYCGTRSGRDGDKIAEAGLTGTATDAGTPAIAEARLVLECRKMYADELREAAFLDRTPVEQWYPQRDFHTLYVLEIERAYVKQAAERP